MGIGGNQPDHTRREQEAATERSDDTDGRRGKRVTVKEAEGDRNLMRKLQEDDITLAGTKQRAVTEEEARRLRVGFYHRNGLLYCTWQSAKHPRERADQLVVPRYLREKVLYTAHSPPSAGHLGTEKTKERVLKRYYWPGVFRDVAEYCRTCGPCQKTAKRRGRDKAELVNMPKMTRPFERVAFAIVGPLQRSKRGNKYMLVLCDYATRYPEATPLPSVESEKVADALIETFS